MLPPLSELGGGEDWCWFVTTNIEPLPPYYEVTFDQKHIPHLFIRTGDWMYVFDHRPEEYMMAEDLIADWPYLQRTET